jgi:hypothetical protein
LTNAKTNGWKHNSCFNDKGLKCLSSGIIAQKSAGDRILWSPRKLLNVWRSCVWFGGQQVKRHLYSL